MSNDTHYFANHALAWAVAPTREEAIEKLLLQGTDPTWVRNCLKSGNFVTVYSCKVHADIKTPYKIEWFQPKGVESSDGQNHLVTYLTKTKYATHRDPADESHRLRHELKERTQLLRNLSYAVACAESIHDSHVVKFLEEAKEFAVPADKEAAA